MRTGVALVLMAACYAPSVPTGASCANGEPCPDGLVCASATRTCELTQSSAVDGSPVGGELPPPDDAAPGTLAITLLGIGESSVTSNVVRVKLDTPVPAGAFLVAAFASRGTTPTTMSDKKNNPWTRDVEVNNSTNTMVAAVFHTTVAAALDQGDEITASVATSGGFLRRVAVFRLDGVTQHDQSGSAMTTGTSPTVTTAGSVASPAQIMVGVVATGFNDPDTFAPAAGFTEVDEFGTQFSSGTFETKLTTMASGPQTMTVGTTRDTANYAVVLSTYR